MIIDPEPYIKAASYYELETLADDDLIDCYHNLAKAVELAEKQNLPITMDGRAQLSRLAKEIKKRNLHVKK